ncbi:hypothetical protein [Methylophilus sp. 3sh_L]|uniref:hypothetical protein n=1 Tax=Methylophilus sp. 3sh_L TaxID=3377114 RepID=UPI00398F2EEA
MNKLFNKASVIFLIFCLSSLTTNAGNDKSSTGFDIDEERREQAVQDAKAMIKESWEQYKQTISLITTGFKCDVVDDISASVAIRKIQFIMQDEKNHSGLIDDTTLDIEKLTQESIKDGKVAAENGACKKMTASQRVQLRSLVSNLSR